MHGDNNDVQYKLQAMYAVMTPDTAITPCTQPPPPPEP